MHASNNILEWADKLTVFNLSAEDKPHDIIGMSTVNQLGLPYSRVTQHNGTVWWSSGSSAALEASFGGCRQSDPDDDMPDWNC